MDSDGCQRTEEKRPGSSSSELFHPGPGQASAYFSYTVN